MKETYTEHPDCSLVNQRKIKQTKIKHYKTKVRHYEPYEEILKRGITNENIAF